MSTAPQYIGIKLVRAVPLPSGEAKKRGYRTEIEDENEPGYEVIYEGGYKSWNPASVFEAAYRTVNKMPFGFAVEAMKNGMRVARGIWQSGYTVSLDKSTGQFMLNHPEGNSVKWEVAPHEDLLADDYIIVQ